MSAVSKADRAPTGRHSGRHSAPPPPRPSRRRAALLLVEVVVAMAAWVLLVYLAIQFGPGARTGDHAAWAMLGTATLGAVLCLFLALVLGARFATVLRERRRPPGVPGGRRARR